MATTHNSLASLFYDIAEKVRKLKGTSSQIVADEIPSALSGLPLPVQSVEFMKKTATENGPANVKKVYGKTVVWNQLFSHVMMQNMAAQYQNASYNESENTIVRPLLNGLDGIIFSTQTTSEHKYLIKQDIYFDRVPTVNGYPVYYGATTPTEQIKSGWNSVNAIFVASASSTTIGVRLGATGESESLECKLKNLVLFDLTLMFGAGNEPSTVEEFKSTFPLDYYPYNAGEIQNLMATDLVAYSGEKRVWNQLVKNGNFEDSSLWDTQGGTISVSDNTLTLTATAGDAWLYQADVLTPSVTHKFYFGATVNPSRNLNVRFSNWLQSTSNIAVTSGQWQRISAIMQITTPAAYNGLRACICAKDTNVDDTLDVRNFICVDLTTLYGAGNEPSTVAEFEEDYPDAYYHYDAGTIEGSHCHLNIPTITSNNTAIFPNGMADVFGTKDELSGEVATVRNLVFTPSSNNINNYTWWAYRGVYFSNQLPNSELRAKYISKNFGTNQTAGESTPNTESFIWIGANGTVVYHIMSVSYAQSINVYDSVNDKIDLTAYASWLNGLDDASIVYATSTQQRLLLDTPLDLSYNCNTGDTEEMVTTNNIPLNAEIEYKL